VGVVSGCVSGVGAGVLRAYATKSVRSGHFQCLRVSEPATGFENPKTY
jgi:hypothetical protein